MPGRYETVPVLQCQLKVHGIMKFRSGGVLPCNCQHRAGLIVSGPIFETGMSRVRIACYNSLRPASSEHSPGRKRFRQLMKRSAVAMILQVREGELHILMIKRAEREGDPVVRAYGLPRWAHGQDGPDHGYAVAVRETEEEVGLVLGAMRCQCIGRLSDINARPHKGLFWAWW